MSDEVRTEFTGDASSLAAATAKAQEGLTGVLTATTLTAARLGQLNQVVELATKAQKALTVASAFLATGTAAVTAAIKAQTAAFLTSPLAPVAAAVIALGAAYAYLSSEVEESNVEVAESAKKATEAQKAMEKLRDLRTSIADKEALATGKVTQAGLDLRDAISEVTAVYGPQIEATKKAIEEQEALAAKNKAFIATGEGVGAVIQNASDKQQEAERTAARLRGELAGLVDTQGKLLQSTARGILITEEDRKGKEKTAKAVKEVATAEELWIKALVEGTLYNLERSAKASTERAAIEKKNAEIIAEAAEETEIRRTEAGDASLERFREQEAEYTAALKQGIADREELNRQYAESAAAVATESLALVQDIARQELDSRTAVIERLQTKLEEGEATLTEKQKESLKERIAANKDAAVHASHVAQGVAAAQAAISTALAVVNALASPVPYPVAVGFAVAAGVAGAASLAAILSEPEPSFHAGGVRPPSPDESMSRTLPGEGWANRQAMNDPANRAALNAMNGGHSVAPVTTLRIGRYESREIARTDIRAGGIIPQTIRSMSRRSASGAGRSGRGALA
jgi:hypothetical protein